VLATRIRQSENTPGADTKQLNGLTGKHGWQHTRGEYVKIDATHSGAQGNAD
jgi:hypothetical protein